MGPTKVIVKRHALYDVKTGTLLKAGLATQKEQEDYATHHYIVLPVADHAGQPWLLDGKPVYCLRGSRYETSDDQVVHLARCPDCGGMCISTEEVTMERDCIRCTSCGHEFESRLEMMES
jgi:predicted Zn-ribbon and HTH transcriptional regulator